jgi:hypothetical protein
MTILNLFEAPEISALSENNIRFLEQLSCEERSLRQLTADELINIGLIFLKIENPNGIVPSVNLLSHAWSGIAKRVEKYGSDISSFKLRKMQIFQTDNYRAIVFYDSLFTAYFTNEFWRFSVIETPLSSLRRNDIVFEKESTEIADIFENTSPKNKNDADLLIDFSRIFIEYIENGKYLHTDNFKTDKGIYCYNEQFKFMAEIRNNGVSIMNCNNPGYHEYDKEVKYYSENFKKVEFPKDFKDSDAFKWLKKTILCIYC